MGPRARVRHERILDAARRVFMRQGVEHTRVEDLITEAGIARATFYRAFSSIDEVVTALYNAYTERVLARLEMNLPSEDPPEQWFDRVVGEVIEDSHNQGPLLCMLHREELRPGSSAAQFRAARVGEQVKHISHWWRRVTGLPADDVVIHCCVLLLQAVTLMMAQQTTSAEEREQYRGAIRFMLQAVVDSYRAGNRP